MPKRPQPISTADKTKKRRKASPTQSLIHHFFTKYDNSGRSLTEKRGDEVQPELKFEFKSTPEVIDIDMVEESQAREGPENPPPNMSRRHSRRSFDWVPVTIATSAQGEAWIYDDLTQDPLTYEPPLKPWTTSSVPYSFLTHTLVTLNGTRSRIAIINVLTNAIRTIILRDPTALLPTLYLISNTLTPPYISFELGLGPSIVSRSIQHVSGLTSSALKRLYNTHGDAGDVAFAAKSNLRTLLPLPPLLVENVFESLMTIAGSQGQGSSKKKQKIVEKLLLSATGEEVRFLTRTLAQNLRVGAVRASILAALSRAMVLTPISHFGSGQTHSSFHASSDLLTKIRPLSTRKGNSRDSARDEVSAMFAVAESLVKRIYVQHPNYGRIVETLLQGGLDDLEGKVCLTVGVPLHPALGSPARSLDEIYDISCDRPFMAEFKYDGQRAQIHGSIVDGQTSITIFSRHLEDMTSKYPDVVSLVNLVFETYPENTSFILDAEIVAIDRDGNLKSFQELSNRPRKSVELHEVRVSVCVFAFDLMYSNGEILLGLPFRIRRAMLHSRLPPFSPKNRLIARFDHVKSCGSEQGRGAVEAFWEDAIDSCCEGLMVKLLDNEPVIQGGSDKTSKSKRKQLPATYEPDKRTSAWLKLKKDYVTGLGDSLDLIPIGAWYGNGRKASWWSPILLGLWQPETSHVVAVCKCMSGFTDDFYKELGERYHLTDDSETCSVRPLWDCDFGGFKPEVYFRPHEVWEIRGADITLSPISSAAKGLTSSSRGLSVRFPRYLRARSDKNVDQASTPHFLVNMWRQQQRQRGPQGGADEGELVDLGSDTMGNSDRECSE